MNDSLRATRFLHPYWMLGLAPVIWATSNITGKLSVGLLTPYQFTFYRWLCAALLLSLFAWPHIRRDWPQLWARKWWLLLWGGSAFALFNILLYAAFNSGAKIANVAIIHSVIPVLVIVGNQLVFKERNHPLQWLGVALATFGVLWLLSRGNLPALLHLPLQGGDALVLLTALIYAAYSMVLRHAPPVHWASLMWAMCVAAMLFSLPFWGVEMWRGGQWLATQADGAAVLKAVLLVFYVSVFVAVLSKMFYMEGVIAVGASRGALVMNLLPVFNVMAAFVFADERAAFGWVHFTAMLSVFAGIALSEYGAYRRRSGR